ncbi:MAG TPA: hypothetical protein VGB07_30010 [Blastocatellia bacterium]
MDSQYLSSYFTLSRRYSRSVNLERDLTEPESLSGYVITARAEQALRRIVEGFAGLHSTRSWMMTSVYGTGKSAFAHFLSSLCAPRGREMRAKAEEILRGKVERSLVKQAQEALPNKGFVRAVVTAQREPISHTITRALSGGVSFFWKSNSETGADFLLRLEAMHKLQAKGKPVDEREILKLIRDVAEASGTGLILVIDELGKCLEYAARNRGANDLYLLQQISELPADKSAPVYLIGMLHQAFSEYGYGMGTVERNEWTKIQGRFEEIAFTEPPSQMAQLIGHVIQREPRTRLDRAIKEEASLWYERLSAVMEIPDLTAQVFADACPLHPVTALALPQLCLRYAQNDRSLFTFLTSAEPHSLRTYLKETRLLAGNHVPLLKLDRLYDYFVDAAGVSMASRPNFQRWSEVKGLIEDHRTGDADELLALKTIGVLNLASTAGFLKGSRRLITLALSATPDDQAEEQRWERVLDALIARGLVVHRRGVDELRIWEGSDFNIEAAITEQLEQQRAPLSALLAEACPLRPLVVQRHSYRTGTLRLFERRYLDAGHDLGALTMTRESDGLLGYWLDDAPPASVPATTADGKPFVLVAVAGIETLRLCALEATALGSIRASAAELQTDGVARREVRHRLIEARRRLDDSRALSFEGGAARCWIAGQVETPDLRAGLNARLSDLCDEVYSAGLTLWNEQINRQELTSQGARARGQVIAAMIENPGLENLGLQGFGPEVSVYFSALRRTGIHRQLDGSFGLHPPTDERIKAVWEAIEDFCCGAKDAPLTLDRLYDKLCQPPYGVKAGVIPLLLAAVVLRHSDDLSVYKDGTFIPVLGAEHFDLLVKQPARFAVKYYEVTGLRAEVFRELEGVLTSGAKMLGAVRNRTLLGVVSPLLQFVRRLPAFAQRTRRVSTQAQAVRQALLAAHEPDKLLFEMLPAACGLEPIADSGIQDPRLPRELRARLQIALKELRDAHEQLLGQCRDYIHEAFGVRQDESRLREDLRSRASYLQGRSIEPVLSRFTFAATDDSAEEQQWLQSLVMVIADKPSESWTDADADVFELKLSDISRRFKHLEAIIRDNAAMWNSSAEARRLSVTRTDGTEFFDVAWIDEHERAALESKAEEIIRGLNLVGPQQRALLAILTEKILSPVAASLPKITATAEDRGREPEAKRGRR